MRVSEKKRVSLKQLRTAVRAKGFGSVLEALRAVGLPHQTLARVRRDGLSPRGRVDVREKLELMGVLHLFAR